MVEYDLSELTSMRILLADDDTNIHFIMKMWMNRNGHEVVSVYNGEEALAKLKEQEFEGLITDVNMPLKKGIDLVKEVLQLSRRPKLIVVLTSRCDTSQLRQQLDCCDVHLFTKPFSPSVLAELIEKLDKEMQSSHEYDEKRPVAKPT
jgi:DNA-binding response OmpR family regulator